MPGILGGLILAKGTTELVNAALDAFLAGLDRGLIASTIRKGEADGLTAKAITDQLVQTMKDAGIEADRDIAGIPD